MKQACVISTFSKISAAINASNVLWSLPVKLHIVVIHLNEFHFIKDNFGKLISELLVSKTKCSSPEYALRGVLVGSHYNRGWIIHPRLYNGFFSKNSWRRNKLLFCNFDEDQMCNCHELIEDAAEFFTHHNAFKDEIRKGVCRVLLCTLLLWAWDAGKHRSSLSWVQRIE